MKWAIYWGPKIGKPTGNSSADPDRALLEEIAGYLRATHDDKTYWVDRAAGETSEENPGDTPKADGAVQNSFGWE